MFQVDYSKTSFKSGDVYQILKSTYRFEQNGQMQLSAPTVATFLNSVILLNEKSVVVKILAQKRRNVAASAPGLWQGRRKKYFKVLNGTILSC